MEIYSKVNSEIIRDTMECIGIKMGILTKEHGKMMSKKGLENWNYPMDNIIKENF